MTGSEACQEHRVFIAIGVSVFVWIALLIAAIATEERGSSSLRPPAPPVTVPFDNRLRTGSDDLPLEQLARQGGAWDPEQIHLAVAGKFGLFLRKSSSLVSEC